MFYNPLKVTRYLQKASFQLLGLPNLFYALCFVNKLAYDTEEM